VPVWAFQEDGAVQCVAERYHGDCGGAGEGGRGCAQQEQRRVRLSGFIVVWLRCSQCGGGRSVHSALELQECQLGLCRRTALHFASEAVNTEMVVALAKAGADVHSKSNDGYGSRATSLCGCVAQSAGADGPVHSALELQEWLF
jgi:hypothetical protein